MLCLQKLLIFVLPKVWKLSKKKLSGARRDEMLWIQEAHNVLQTIGPGTTFFKLMKGTFFLKFRLDHWFFFNIKNMRNFWVPIFQNWLIKQRLSSIFSSLTIFMFEKKTFRKDRMQKNERIWLDKTIFSEVKQ